MDTTEEHRGRPPPAKPPHGHPPVTSSPPAGRPHSHRTTRATFAPSRPAARGPSGRRVWRPRPAVGPSAPRPAPPPPTPLLARGRTPRGAVPAAPHPTPPAGPRPTQPRPEPRSAPRPPRRRRAGAASEPSAEGALPRRRGHQQLGRSGRGRRPVGQSAAPGAARHITPAGGGGGGGGKRAAGRERARPGGEVASARGSAAGPGLGLRTPSRASYRRRWPESRRLGRCCRHRCSRE